MQVLLVALIQVEIILKNLVEFLFPPSAGVSILASLKRHDRLI